MKFKNLSIFLTAALFFAACSDDSTVGTTSSGEEVAVQLSFKTVSMEQAGSSTRGGSSVLNLGGGDASGIDFSASTTRSVDVSGMDESAISNLWVFQYVTGGSFVRRQYFSSVDVADFRMDLSTNVSGQTSNLYFVANVGPSAFPDVLATESAFKANGIAVTDEASVLPTAGFVPMFGSLSALTLPDDFVNESQVITLTRMVSRVDFSFQLASTGLPSGFLIKSVRLKSVPGKSFPYKDAAATTFPALTDVTLRDFDYEAITATDQTSSAVLLSFYLPENMRGDGTSTTQAGKTGITGATCIQLVGYSDGDEITYNIYPGEDAIANYDLTRNTTYTVSAAITGIYENDARVKKTPLANTYIVRSGSSINIPVKRANQTAALGEQLADITTGWTSSILWRDNSGLTITTDDATLQSEGFFTVKASDMSATGNALVCIKDASNNVLWSWQIWVTSYDPDSENETYNSYTFMDRNLGATSDVAGTATALGLLYQWGRKDPFAGSSVITSGNTTLKTLYSGGSGSTTYTSTSTTRPTTSANNLETSVRNPGVFYYGSASPYDWYPGSSTTQNDVLWGTTKTVYDPCPSGWKVAPLAAFGTWSTGTSTWNSTNLGRTFTAASGSWYPASGARNSSSGALISVGTIGYYCSSAVTGTNGSYLNINSSTVTPAGSTNRGSGFSLRCVQE